MGNAQPRPWDYETHELTSALPRNLSIDLGSMQALVIYSTPMELPNGLSPFNRVSVLKFPVRTPPGESGSGALDYH